MFGISSDSVGIEVEILQTRVIIYFSPHCMATETPLFSGGFCFVQKIACEQVFCLINL